MKKYFGWPIQDEYSGIAVRLTFVPFLYAFSIGAATQVLARMFTQQDYVGEVRIRVFGCVCLALGPIYLYLA